MPKTNVYINKQSIRNDKKNMNTNDKWTLTTNNQ